MSIEMPADRVRALGRSLSARADTADEARARLVAYGDVAGPLHVPVERFLGCQGTLADALAGELRWLGDTVVGIADAWVRLDAVLVPTPDGGPGR